jgi:hypothetical protein
LSIASSWRAKILEDATVTALVGSRMYPNHAPQTPTYPFLVYRRREARRDYSIDGPSELNMCLYEIIAYSTDYAEAWSVIDAIAAHLDGFKGTSGGINYVHNLFVFDRDDYDDKLEVHMAVARFDVWYVVA